MSFLLALVLAATQDRASDLHRRSLVLDTHADTTQQMIYESFDLGERASQGHVDIPRMREGGLDAVFFSIWMPGTLSGPDVVKRSLRQIDAVREQVRRHPQDLVLATTAVEVRKAQEQGKIAVLMGMEGGHMIDDDLGVLRMYAELGVRYLTLTHFQNNHWADSSTDTPEHNGLTEFGKDVVRELNRLGVMVDISHVADKTFYDVLEISKAPLMASHSSCRAISDHPRNMGDDMIRALASKGGVIQINYEITFLSQEARDKKAAEGERVENIDTQFDKLCGENTACEIRERERIDREAMERGELPQVSWQKIVEHIDHVVKLVGPDHVGLGSDFDGASMPLGMDDVSKLPRLTEALLSKGYREEDIEKILGGNLLRVMEATERVKAELNR
ncbi:MAG TPA: dipeptidase [Vicinamibacteria bacterium]|nr:dipeptidase [Vicinamibacteria bacterium]